MVVFSGIKQDKKETLCAYINRFTKMVVAVEGSDESLKC